MKSVKANGKYKGRMNLRRRLKEYPSKLTSKYQCIHCKRLFFRKCNHDQHFKKKHYLEFLLYVNPKLVETKGTTSENNLNLGHRMYGNPFGRAQFLTSQSAVIDETFILQRKKVKKNNLI